MEIGFMFERKWQYLGRKVLSRLGDIIRCDHLISFT